MRYVLLMAIMSYCFCSCAQLRSEYEVEIRYSPIRHIIPSKTTEKSRKNYGDSVLVFFEEGFDKDYITVTDSITTVKDVITSNSSLGFARLVPLGRLNNTKTIQFSVNKGQTIAIDINMKHRYVAINFVKNKIIVEILDGFPYYD